MILCCNIALTPVLFRFSFWQICWRFLLSMPWPLTRFCREAQSKAGVEAILLWDTIARDRALSRIHEEEVTEIVSFRKTAAGFEIRIAVAQNSLCCFFGRSTTSTGKLREEGGRVCWIEFEVLGRLSRRWNSARKFWWIWKTPSSKFLILNRIRAQLTIYLTMAKGARASTNKANNAKLKSRVFGPVETERTARLSAKLLELASQPKPTRDDVAMGEEEGSTS